MPGCNHILEDNKHEETLKHGNMMQHNAHNTAQSGFKVSKENKSNTFVNVTCIQKQHLLFKQIQLSNLALLA